MKIKRIPKFSRPSGIPSFAGKTVEEEARFWDTHSVGDYMHELKQVHGIKFPKPRKRLISMRIDDAQIKSLKEIAATKGIGYLTLMRMWIIERLFRERKTLHAHHG